MFHFKTILFVLTGFIFSFRLVKRLLLKIRGSFLLLKRMKNYF
ncbi:hypothetical protein LEP1GSC150_4944 [Leptospira interrogans serovar Copenhageni str. LT2050]|uniref:Uncharacterized protein n=1 Tax=Leptospira interrogans serovar Copenhageni str. LT2050 TaxID=1001598 RepID=M3HQ41_LEPIT|nr:hypothetical protein LEP1GSC150_4944 [Leptospira interrogans serovar Copenhageni str. LT2050]